MAGCCGGSCSCKIEAVSPVVVEGLGTTGNPFVISLDGPAVPANLDEQNAALLEDDGSLTSIAADARSEEQIATLVPPMIAREAATNQGLYLPNQMSGRKWRRKRAAVLAGLERAHVAVTGDSIAFGAAATGNTPPKNQTSYPGRLRAMLEKAGLYGGGFTPANAAIRANPTWDPRWTYAGTVTDHAFGFHKSACFRIASGSAANYIEFTEYCDEFVVYNLSSGGGIINASIDGGATFFIRNVAVGGATPAYEKEPGYAPSQIVTRIPAGALGNHTLRLSGSTTTSGVDVFVVGIKHVITGNGKIEVSNASISGKSMSTLWSGAGMNDEVNGLNGLPMIDMLKADMLVFALGINDWQGNRTLASAQADLVTLIARQTTSGNAPTGAPKANGDVMLMWNPQPNTAVLGTTSPQTWSQWNEGWYGSAVAGGCPLFDLGDRWINYATGNTAGYFADTIHPSDAGSLDMVSALYEVLMHRI